MHVHKADIVDLFSSLQGEGVFLGARQIFVRFKQCNLTCRYCDEPRDGQTREYSPQALMHMVRALEVEHGPHHSVSLTGGEPLVYAPFVQEFARLLKKKNFKTYLETNGTLPEALATVIDAIDIIAMDIKLPSSTGLAPFWETHEQFLRCAMQRNVFVKVVVTPLTTRDDVTRAIRLVKDVSEHIPLILQPASPVRSSDTAIDTSALLSFLEIASRHKAENVRVIPQLHRVLNIK